MKLFGRTGGYYLFWTGVIYFVTGVICAIWFTGFIDIVIIGWMAVLALPFIVPQIGRYFNLRPLFGEDSMWRKREYGDNVSKDIEDNNVLKFPEVKPDLKLVTPPQDSIDDTRPPYTIGRNESGNVQLSMKTSYGSTWLTMNEEGVINLIEDLAHYIRQTHHVEITTKE